MLAAAASSHKEAIGGSFIADLRCCVFTLFSRNQRAMGVNAEAIKMVSKNQIITQMIKT
jgi:hypothetical protein